MQLATRLCRIGSNTSRREVTKSDGSRSIAYVHKVSGLRKSTQMKMTRRAYTFKKNVTDPALNPKMSLLQPGTVIPEQPEIVGESPVPKDLMEEAQQWKLEVEEMEEEEAKMVMVDLIQVIATQVGLIQRSAAHLKKDVRDITALDVATYRLHEHEEFVSKVELDKVVLFSHETSLANFRAGLKSIASRYPDNKLPSWLQTALDANEKSLVERVANQEILELQVSEDVYQTAQKNLFPSFVSKGITPQELLDFVGGPEGLIHPVTFHVRDLLIQLETAPVAQKAELLAKLETTITQFEDDLGDEYTEEESADFVAQAMHQQIAERTLAQKAGLNRGIKMGDLNPERRLERSLEINHPILDVEQVYYVHGDVTNLKDATKQIMNNEAPEVQIEHRADFNPPTVYRPLDYEGLAIEPETLTYAQKQALNFPMWEGIEAASAINSTELIVEMKLYKFFNYMYPMLSDTPNGQKAFMEMFDISPGEPTLEWVLGFPTKEHTFFPEHPMWVHVFEDDEDVAPVVWPNYTPVAVEGAAEVISSHGGQHVTVKFLPHSKETVAAEAQKHFVLSRLPVEKRFATTPEEVKQLLASLSSSEKQEADKYWASLTPAQKILARDAAHFQSSPDETAAQFVKNQEALAKLEQRVLSNNKL